MLIELVVSLALLSVVVPTSVVMLRHGLDRRADSIQLVRANALMTGLAEQIVADASSGAPGLGFGAFADADAYLETPDTGFRARAAGLTDPYTAQGFSYQIEIGPLVDQTLAAPADAADGRYRVVQIMVIAPAATVNAVSIPLELVISEMGL